MIFVTIGTHYKDFSRFVKRIDEIAPFIKDKIVVQIGHTKYIPKNCESFDFAPSLNPYYKKANIVVMHGGSSVWEFMYQYNKPLIVVPRQSKYGEHVNDHQVDFAEYVEKTFGIKSIYEMDDLTADLLNRYNKKIKFNPSNLKNLQKFLKLSINQVCDN
jgi:UDP-N-acetylglucosamine transferase subunit ALG13